MEETFKLTGDTFISHAKEAIVELLRDEYEILDMPESINLICLQTSLNNITGMFTDRYHKDVYIVVYYENRNSMDVKHLKAGPARVFELVEQQPYFKMRTKSSRRFK